MAFVLVTMTHPDGTAGIVMSALMSLICSTSSSAERFGHRVRCRASASGRAGFIIMTVDSPEEARRLVAEEPFSMEGLIEDLTITEWDPMFGAFSEESSRPPKGARPT